MRRTTIAILALGLATSAAQVPVAAEDLKLTLSEALRKALTNNLDLVIARKDPKIAEVGIDSSEAPFDPVVGAATTYTSSQTDQNIGERRTYVDPPGLPDEVSTSSLSPSSTRWDAGASWTQKLKFGGEYELKWDYSVYDPSASLQILGPNLAILSDTKSRSATPYAHFSMPLLQGLGTEVNTVDILLAQSGLMTSREQLLLTAETTMKAVEDAYWDLKAAREAQRVALESLKLAQDLLDLNKKKVEVGTLAPIEITQAEAGVASREEGVIVAETAVQNAEDRLRQLLAFPKDDPAWSATIDPVDKPDYKEVRPDVEASIATALERRPEMINARQGLKDSELSARVAKNGLRHSLKLDASMWPIGRTEDYRVGPATDVLERTFVERLDEYNEKFDWSIGLTYGYPIGNRASKAKYSIATLKRDKAEVGVHNTELGIRVDVRTAARAVESGVKRVAAARANTVLQRKTLEAEQKKFDNGMSTSFEVLRIQTDLLNAQVAEIQAILDYTKALADLERAKGTLLEARGLKLE